MAMETRAVSSIKAGGRVRQDLGDLDKLVKSIKANGGLLQPILIRSDGRLIAGSRRLAACKAAERDFVEVNVRDDLTSAVALLIAERDENTCRKDFNPSEMVEMGRRLEELERPAAEQRERAGRPSADSAEGPKGNTRDKVAEALDVGRTKYEHAKKVVEAADEGDPIAEQAVREMDATGKVEPAYKKVVASDNPPAAVTNGTSKRQKIRDDAAQRRLDKALIHIDGICGALADADLGRAVETADAAVLSSWLSIVNRANKTLGEVKKTLKEGQ